MPAFPVARQMRRVLSMEWRDAEQEGDALMYAAQMLEWTFAFSLYADHYQFYIGDSWSEADTAAPEFWSDDAFARRLAVGDGLLAVGTEVYGTVPVVVELFDCAPIDDLRGWDHVVEASLDVPSGLIAIDGCLNYVPKDLPHIGYRSPVLEVAPGVYRARIYYGNLGSLRVEQTHYGEEEVSDEHYRVVLWPAPPADPAILRYKGPR